MLSKSENLVVKKIKIAVIIWIKDINYLMKVIVVVEEIGVNLCFVGECELNILVMNRKSKIS